MGDRQPCDCVRSLNDSPSHKSGWKEEKQGSAEGRNQRARGRCRDAGDSVPHCRPHSSFSTSLTCWAKTSAWSSSEEGARLLPPTGERGQVRAGRVCARGGSHRDGTEEEAYHVTLLQSGRQNRTHDNPFTHTRRYSGQATVPRCLKCGTEDKCGSGATTCKFLHSLCLWDGRLRQQHCSKQAGAGAPGTSYLIHCFREHVHVFEWFQEEGVYWGPREFSFRFLFWF